MQKFKARLNSRRPANIDRGLLVKVFPETPAGFVPEWRLQVYGDADWVHFRCPLDRSMLDFCLRAVVCRGNNRLLMLEGQQPRSSLQQSSSRN